MRFATLWCLSVSIIFELFFFNTPQANDEFAIFSGNVTDLANGKPVPFVDVFLSNTTIGTLSSKTGTFRITNIPPGRYKVVVSRIGYEVECFEVEFRPSKAVNRDFKLKAGGLSLPEVEVKGEVDKDWRKNYEYFKRLFFGETADLSACDIVNPEEVFDFKGRGNSGDFSVIVKRPFEIVNRGLGYKIMMILEIFSLNGSKLRYLYDTKFTELEPADDDEEKRWRKNRIKAYRGSFAHFVNSLYDNTFEKEGFLVRLTPYMIEEPTLNLSREFPVSGIKLPEYNSRKMMNKIYSKSVFPYKINFHFTEYLEINYLFEDDTFRSTDYQRSYLRLPHGSVSVDAAGKCSDVFAIERYWYWSKVRFSEMLPVDYELK